MKVFKIETEGAYCSGMMIVAAENMQAALQFVSANDDIKLMFDLDFSSPDSIVEMAFVNYMQNGPCVLAIHEFGE